MHKKLSPATVSLYLYVACKYDRLFLSACPLPARIFVIALARNDFIRFDTLSALSPKASLEEGPCLRLNFRRRILHRDHLSSHLDTNVERQCCIKKCLWFRLLLRSIWDP